MRVLSPDSRPSPADFSLAPAPPHDEAVAWPRLLWVAPLTVVAALLVNLLLRTLIEAVDPSSSQMGQLQQPMLTLTLEGAIAAVAAFVIVAALIKHRPIFWYRVLAVVALVLSLVPDLLLGLGGAPMQLAQRLVMPLLSLAPRSAPPASAPSAAASASAAAAHAPTLSAMAPDHVLILMLLHVATFAVCVLLLTTLPRRHAAAAG